MSKTKKSNFWKKMILAFLVMAVFFTNNVTSVEASAILKPSSKKENIATRKTVQTIQLDKTACVIVKGKKVKVKVNGVLPSTASSEVKWKLNKSSIAKVIVKGNTAVIKGKKAGKATLTATAADGSKKNAKVDIVVVNKKSDIKKINQIKVSLVQKEIYVGDTIKAKAIVSPSKITLKKVLWSSANEKIAKIKQTGKITALKAGTVKIIAFAQDGSGKKGTVKLVINEKLQATAESTKQPEATATPTKEPTKQPEVTATPTKEPTKQPEAITTPTKEPTKQPEATVTPTEEPTKQSAPEEGMDYIIDYINETIVPAFAPGEKHELEYGIGFSVDEEMKKFQVKDGCYVPVSMEEFVGYGDATYGAEYFMIRFAEDEENLAGEVKKIELFNSPTEAEQILEDAIYKHNISKEGFFDYENQKTKVAIPDTVYYTTSSEGFSETSQWIQGNNEVIGVEPGTVIYIKRMSSQEEKKFEYYWWVLVPERPDLSKVTIQMTNCYRKEDGNRYFIASFKNMKTNLHYVYCFSDELITNENAFNEMKMYYLEEGEEKKSIVLLNDDDSLPKYCYMKSCSTSTDFESKWSKLKEVSGDNEFSFDDIP